MSICDNSRIKDRLIDIQVEKDLEVKKYIKKSVFDQLLGHQFAQYNVVQGDGAIVVTGYVANDGLGDWACMVKVAKYLQKQFPETVVHLFVESDSKHRGKLSYSPLLKSVDIVYDRDSTYYSRERQILKIVEQASLILMGPLSVDDKYRSIADQIRHKTRCIFEYDGATNLSELGGREEILLGLGTASVGILTSSPKKRYQWSDLAQKNLKKILFNNKAPTEEEIASYEAGRELYFCYTREQAIFEFIKDIAILTQNTNQMIDNLNLEFLSSHQ